MIRRALLLTLLLSGLAACSGTLPEVDKAPEPIGDFRLGFNIVVANDITQGPGSRDATEEELTDAVRAAMEERLGPYDGDGLYHIGLRIEAYTLGQTGIPLVFSPRSVFLVAMNIWDDATQEKLNDEPIRITAFDGAAGPLVGGGIVRGREQQIAGLAFDTALEVEEILVENGDTWFGPKEGRVRIEFQRDPATGKQLILEDEDEDDGEAGEPASATN